MRKVVLTHLKWLFCFIVVLSHIMEYFFMHYDLRFFYLNLDFTLGNKCTHPRKCGHWFARILPFASVSSTTTTLYPVSEAHFLSNFPLSFEIFSFEETKSSFSPFHSCLILIANQTGLW